MPKSKFLSLPTLENSQEICITWLLFIPLSTHQIFSLKSSLTSKNYSHRISHRQRAMSARNVSSCTHGIGGLVSISYLLGKLDVGPTLFVYNSASLQTLSRYLNVCSCYPQLM